MKITAPSPALAVSLVALVLAAGGGAYAASTQIHGSQIKDGTITKAKLTPSLRRQINARPLRGLPGLPGATGAPGGFDPSKISYVVGAEVPANPGDAVVADAFCPPGTAAIGGGHFSIGNNFISAALPYGVGWEITTGNDTSIPITVRAFAVCAAP